MGLGHAQDEPSFYYQCHRNGIEIFRRFIIYRLYTIIIIDLCTLLMNKGVRINKRLNNMLVEMHFVNFHDDLIYYI